MSGDLQKAISLIKSGQKEQAQTLLIQILEEDPQNEKAWIWMSGVVDTDELRLECLEEVLKINPNNAVAQKGAAKLRAKLPPPSTNEDEYSSVFDDEFEAEDGWYDPIEPETQDMPVETYKETFSYEDYSGKSDADLIPQSTNKKTPKKRSVLVRSPWLTIWYMPRITIRAILDTDPNKDVLMIAALLGLLGALPGTLGVMLTDFTSLIIGMLITMILGPIIGIIIMYIMGAVLSFTGLMLGGKGTAQEVRTAYAWGNIPTLVIYVFVIPIVAILLLAADSESTAWIGLLGCLTLFAVVIGLYGIYFVFMQSLAEAHQFSYWRAFGTVMLPGIIINCTIWLAAFITGLSV